MRNTTYKWNGHQPGGVTAQVAGEELHRIEQHHGRLNAADVVEHSRAPRAPLHPIFEWNDNIAAEKFRIIQAGRIIRCVVVERPLTSGAPVQVRAFHSLPTERKPNEDTAPTRTFRSVDAIMADAQARTALIHQAAQDLQSWIAKYENLQGVAAAAAVASVQSAHSALRRASTPALRSTAP